MAQKFSIATAADAPTVSHSTDWSLCVFCQKTTNVANLVTPLESSYETLERNLLELKNLNALPSFLCLERLQEGTESIHSTLQKYKAKWHKACRVFYSATIVSRQKRKHSEGELSEGDTLAASNKCFTRSQTTSSAAAFR